MSLVNVSSGMFDWIVQANVGASAHTCSGYTPNLRAYPPDTPGLVPARFVITDSLMSTSSMSRVLVTTTERVIIESLVGGGVSGTTIAKCGGGLIAQSFRGTQNPAAPFTLAPPLACQSVCGPDAFSLRISSNANISNYVYVPASGAVKTGTPVDAGFTAEGASFTGSRQTVNGVTGWVFYPSNGYASGWVLTRSVDNSTCTDSACCGAASNYPVVVTAAPVPAGGLTLNHLWRMQWEVRRALRVCICCRGSWHIIGRG